VDTDRLIPLLLPPTVPAHVRVWQVDVARDEVRLDGLNAVERARCLHYRQHASRVRFAETRLALRALLGERLGIVPDAVAFVAGEHGKPLLEDDLLHFNVSHAGCYALIALSDTTPVGIDIERIDSERAYDDLAGQYYSPPEQAACKGDPAHFFQLWSCKEAVVKAWGTGILDGLPALSASADGISFYPAAAEHPPTRVWRIAAPQGYAAALAIA
jgi:4'-phosphopantetheinyl transferase